MLAIRPVWTSGHLKHVPGAGFSEILVFVWTITISLEHFGTFGGRFQDRMVKSTLDINGLWTATEFLYCSSSSLCPESFTHIPVNIIIMPVYLKLYCRCKIRTKYELKCT